MFGSGVCLSHLSGEDGEKLFLLLCHALNLDKRQITPIPFLLPCSSVEYPSEITPIIHLSMVVFIHPSWKKADPSPSLDRFQRQQRFSGTLLPLCYSYPNQQNSWLAMTQLSLPWVTVESSLSFCTLLHFLVPWSL